MRLFDVIKFEVVISNGHEACKVIQLLLKTEGCAIN